MIRLAWRNLWRNRRRTLITASAIAFGLALLVLFRTIGDGMHYQMIEYGVANQAGHAVVQAKGYKEKPEPELTVPDSPGITEAVRRAAPGAKVVSRVFFQGLLTSPRNSVGVVLVGVEPAAEADVGDLDQKLVEGSYLAPGDDRGLVIGASLAETLEVKVGDKLVLMSQRGGEIQSTLLRVRGLFKTGMQELDGFYGHVPLDVAQGALGLGTGVNQISVHLSREADPDEVAGKLEAALSGAPVAVLGWKQALPELHQFVILDDAGNYVFLLIIAIVVAMGILNTVLMSVLERTREFGVMLSLGMTPLQLGALVLTEAGLLGVVAAAVGAALGALASWPIVVRGLDYGALAGGQEAIATAGVPMQTMIYGDLSLRALAVSALLTVVITVLSAIYPTWRAARLTPVEAMHHHL